MHVTSKTSRAGLMPCRCKRAHAVFDVTCKHARTLRTQAESSREQGGAGRTSRDLMQGGWVSREARKKKIMTLYKGIQMKSRELPASSQHANTVVLARF